jgi:hypothetical protein
MHDLLLSIREQLFSHVTFRYSPHYIRDSAEELDFLDLSGSGTKSGWCFPAAASSTDITNATA